MPRKPRFAPPNYALQITQRGNLFVRPRCAPLFERAGVRGPESGTGADGGLRGGLRDGLGVVLSRGTLRPCRNDAGVARFRGAA